jgi:hypothetical protein
VFGTLICVAQPASAQFVQQGPELVGTGAYAFGTSIALSTDGNTAVVGGFGSSQTFGVAWVFNRSSGVWTQ